MMRMVDTIASFIIVGLIFAFAMMADENDRPIVHAVVASSSSHPPSFVVASRNGRRAAAAARRRRTRRLETIESDCHHHDESRGATSHATTMPPEPPQPSRRRSRIGGRVISIQLAETLDLSQLLDRVSQYARTRRGRMGIIDLVERPPSSSPSSSTFANRRGGGGGGGGRRSRRDRYYDVSSGGGWKRRPRHENYDIDDADDGGGNYIVSVATSADEARSEYELIREATDLLQPRVHPSYGYGDRDRITDVETFVTTTSLPPMFDLFDGEVRGVENGSDDDGDDDDDWLDLIMTGGGDVYDAIDLRLIMKAEQVTKLLLDTWNWAEMDAIRWHVPGLSAVARTITTFHRDDEDDDADGSGREEYDDDNDDDDGDGTTVGPLADLHRSIAGAVEIVRAGPNLMDPNNRISYEFRLASGNGRFPELDALRKREERLLSATMNARGGGGGGGGLNKDIGRELAVVRDEITIMEGLVERKLIRAMISAAPYVKRGMDALGRLDAIFARASYGIDWNGAIPDIGTGGRLRVHGFVHPVLALRQEVDGGGVRDITPVDLRIPGKGEGHVGLVISGPNGGGKTLALKSFGLVTMMAKLAIPITVAGNDADDGRSPPIVDYFDDILVEVGDSQSIRRRESTLMARLNSLSTLIGRMNNTATSGEDAHSTLILLDELGGGTDPVAGSAIAQSILEKLVTMNPDCRIVATTHSPQLKALSASDERFESASVLMNDEKHPSFRLSYGSTGESFALEAAMRASPSLPKDVIDRAAEIMNGGDDVAVNSLRRYLAALEQEERNARDLVKEAEATYREVLQNKDDTISKIEVSRMHLSRLESRLGNIFDTLNRNEGSTYELVGDSLEELRLLKRRLQSEEELLSEKGLRRVSDSYSFYVGETVVIISDSSEFKGYDAVVKGVDAEDPLVVTVVPVLDLFSFNDSDVQEPLAIRRKDVAIFDYPTWGLSSRKNFANAFTDRQKSQNNLMNVLSTLASEKKSIIPKEEPRFVSARQRKASSAAEKKHSKAKKR